LDTIPPPGPTGDAKKASLLFPGPIEETTRAFATNNSEDEKISDENTFISIIPLKRL